MPRSFHHMSRLMTVAAWTLALSVAAGVATPRLRTAGRDRVLRARVARAGGPRAEGTRGWLAPGVAEPRALVAVAAADASAVTRDGLESPALVISPVYLPGTGVSTRQVGQADAHRPNGPGRSATSGRGPPAA